MQIETLIEKIDNLSTEELEESRLLNLLNAVNDWPLEVVSIEEYTSHIKEFLNIQNLSLEVLNEKVKTLDFLKYSWEIESLSEFIIFMNGPGLHILDKEEN